MNAKRIALSILTVVVLVVAGYAMYLRYLAPRPDPEQVTPDPDTITVDTGIDLVSAEGTITPLREGFLAFPDGGRVAELQVGEGTRVEAGQPLIQLEADAFAVALRQAEAAVRQAEAGVAVAAAQLSAAQAALLAAQAGANTAEANLALVAAQPRPEEIQAVESEIAAAEATVAQVSANRDALLEGPTPAELQAAEARVAANLAEEAVIQDQYDQIIRNGVGGPIEEQTRYALLAVEAQLAAAQAALNELQAGARENERRGAAAAVASATARQAAAEAQLALLLAGAREEQVRLAEVEVERAAAAVLQAEAAVAQAEAAHAQAEAALDQAEAAREAAQVTLDRMTLRAPFAGMVAHVAVGVGEVVAPGAPVVTLVDVSGWQVKTTDLTELDIVAVALGDPVDVRVDALPDQVIAGMVTDIATVSALTRGEVTYEVTVALEGTSDLPLRWGMTAFVDVDVDP